MQLFWDVVDFPSELRGGALSIGNFDGVHRGHASLMKHLQAVARAVSGPAVVFTFDPHPVRLLRPESAPPPLTWTERKAELLGELGVDALVAFRTGEAFLAYTPEQFFQHVVLEHLGASALIEGPNFCFGRDRSGDTETLRHLCADAGVRLEIVEPVRDEGTYVSSSRIREFVANGDVRKADELLTRPYRIRGLVTHGDGRGTRIGFPTANLEAIDTLLPAEGVYAGRALVKKETWPAAINIGPNPTFGKHALKVEVHLVGFHGPLYGTVLEVDFLSRIRDIRPFASAEDLIVQLHHDRDTTRQIAQEPGNPELPD